MAPAGARACPAASGRSMLVVPPSSTSPAGSQRRPTQSHEHHPLKASANAGARAARPCARPARVSTSRAAADPPGVERALLVGVVALVALRVLAAWLPGRWLWGLDLGRDIGGWGGW